MNSTPTHNHLPISGLMYSPLESLIGHYRGKKDIGNSLGAAAITGALFKSTGERVCHNDSLLKTKFLGIIIIGQQHNL